MSSRLNAALTVADMTDAHTAAAMLDLAAEEGVVDLDPKPTYLSDWCGPVKAVAVADFLSGGWRNTLWGLACGQHLCPHGYLICLPGQVRQVTAALGGLFGQWIPEYAGLRSLAVALLADRAADLARSAEACRRHEEYQGLERVRKAARRRFALLVGRPVREAAGCPGSSWPVVVVDGAAAPELLGRAYQKYHFSRSYASGKSFARTVYTASTRRIEVGRDWFAAHGLLAHYEEYASAAH